MTVLTPTPAPLLPNIKMFGDVTATFKRVPADLCDRGRWQRREDFDPDKMVELQHSIEQTGGNIVPVILRPIPGTNRYEIVAGERRVRATQLSNIDIVLATIGNFDYSQCAILSAIENLQRADLNPIEQAQSLQALLDEEMTQLEVAKETGISRSKVANLVRLLGLDISVQDTLKVGRISLGQAKPLVVLNKAQQRAMVAGIVKNRMSARQVEAMVAALKKKKLPPEPEYSDDSDIRKMEEQVSEAIGSPVRFKVEKDGGVMQVRYFSLDQLDGIIERLKLTDA